MTLTLDQAAAHGITFRWHDDWAVADHVAEFDCYEDGEPTTCEWVGMYRADELIGSLSCVDDADDDYRRTIETELLAELPEFDTYATEQIDRVVAAETAAVANMVTSLPAAATEGDDQPLYRVQVIANSVSAKTKWLNISAAELSEFRAILARRTL